MSKILIVLTSCSRLGNTGRETGFHFQELTDPYYALLDAGHRIEIASIDGGHPPHDPKSLDDDESKRPASVRRFLNDEKAMRKLKNTRAVDKLEPEGYDAIYMPGGHGTMWDMPSSEPLTQLVTGIYRAGGVVAAVCHGPAALLNATTPAGDLIVFNKQVNCFTDAEEREAGLDDVVPFLLESRLREKGARFEAGAPGQAKAVRDGQLITGQNPASCKALANLMLTALEEGESQRKVLDGDTVRAERQNLSRKSPISLPRYQDSHPPRH